MLSRHFNVFSGYSGFLPQGGVVGWIVWVRENGPAIIGSRCCGGLALVAKLNKSRPIYLESLGDIRDLTKDNEENLEIVAKYDWQSC